MNIPKVSIIVPVYNAGNRLEKRLHSLVHQTLKEIEIILVLDCPTDGSDRVAEKFASQDERIVIVRNPKNLNVGLSRNEGLKVAKGEYIAFSDHDDDSTLDMYEKLYLKGKEAHADVVVSDYYCTNESKTYYMGFPESVSNKEFIEQSLTALLRFRTPKYDNKRSFASQGLIWNQLYKKEFLHKHQIRFQDNRIATAEDRSFLVEVYLSVQQLTLLPEAFYTHIWYPGSTGSSFAYKTIPLAIHYLTYLYQLLKQKNLLKKEYSDFCIGMLLLLYHVFRHELRHQSTFATFKRLSLIRKEPILQSAIRHLMCSLKFSIFKTFPITKICFLLLIRNFSSRQNKS